MRRVIKILFLMFPSIIGAGTIGWCPETSTNQGSGITSSTAQMLNVFHTYTPSVAENVTSISIYTANCGGVNDEIEIAVYDVTSGEDSNATLVNSATITCPNNDLQLCTTSGLSWALTSGNDYDVGIKSNDTSCDLYRTWGARSNHLHNTATGADAFPSAWTDSPTTEGWDNEYCATTEAAPSSGVEIYRRRGR